MNAITLDAATLKALRSCRSIVVASKLDENLRPYDTTVTLRNDENPKFNSVRFLDVEAYLNYYNGFENVKRFERGAVSHVLFHYPSQLSHLGSIFQILQANDKIFFVWGIGGGTTPGLESHEMVGDALYMRVQRGKKLLEFKLESVVCEANSTARMIRPR